MCISAENVAGFDGRLSSIEQNLTSRMELLTELVSQSVKDTGRNRSYRSRSSSQVINDLSGSDLDDELPTRQSGSLSPKSGLNSPTIIVNDGPVERFYGESSTYSHLTRSRSLVESLLTARKRQYSQDTNKRSSAYNSTPLVGLVNEDPSVFAEVQRKYDTFSATSKFKEHFEVGDGKPSSFRRVKSWKTR